MSRDTLREYFVGVAYKRLSAVETDPERSNQHEFNSTDALLVLLGKDKRTLAARFIYLDDELEVPPVAEGDLTWYEARKPPRSEYRLYYRENPVCDAAAEGDLLLIAVRPDETLLVVIARAGSTAERQVLLLFKIDDKPKDLEFKELDREHAGLDVARRIILGQIGVEAEAGDESFLDQLLRKFPNGFPKTKVFSAFARGTLPDVSAVEDPDAALATWWEREELLFRTLERHIVAERLRKGFGEDVDSFLEYSLSTRQIRMSRAGSALENHVEQVVRDHGIRYSRGKYTEGKRRPDFLFPGHREYHDDAFDASSRTMLGVKSTCKDRWRQVLSEAKKIEEKHLLTLEPAISPAQTDEMKASRLRLVLPRSLHDTFQPAQREWLLAVTDFLELVRGRQSGDG